MMFTVIYAFSDGSSEVRHLSDLSFLRTELDEVCIDLDRSPDSIVSFYVLNNSLLTTSVVY